MTNQNGVALIIVILMISIIVALTIQLNRDMRSEVYEAANLSDQIRLRYVAESGIHAAEALLLADKNSFDALSEEWANTEMLSLKSEEFFDNASFKLLIEDEGGKIPINLLVGGNVYNAPIRDMTLRLLTGPYFRLEQKAAEELVDSIKDWIDADNETTGKGGEVMVKNAPLDCIDELLMIKGVSRELFYGSDLFFGLAHCLRVFGDGTININTAPKAVLRAMSAQMTDEAVEALDEYRRNDKNPVSDPGWYGRVPEVTGLNIPSGIITVKTDTFRIKAEAMQGRMTRQVVAVVKRAVSTNKVTTLSWRVD
jgi:general secretion pathway protein K